MANNNATNTAIASSLGCITKPLQPCFCAKLTADVPNLTGNSTTITVPYNTLYFGSGFDTATFTYTAPITGIYIFGCTVTYYSVPTPTICTVGIRTTLKFYDGNYSRGQNLKTSTNLLSYNYIITAPMTVGDTAYVESNGIGSTKTMGVLSGDASIFWGYLIA